LHYDTAASAYEPSMRAALAYLPSASLLFGTDHPHYEVPRTVSNFAQLSMSRAIKQAIQRDNPRRFLSRLPVWHG
jgi:predicted TIM-barrel fold metal-dependent hydrolase